MALTQQKILDAEEDLNDLAAIINGGPTTDVVTRTGGTVPSLQKRLAPYSDAAALATAAEAAATSADADATTATNAAAAASADAASADADRIAAQSAKTAAETARDAAGASAVTAGSHKDAAAASATAAAGSASDADADRIAADNARIAAEAAQAAAEAAAAPSTELILDTVAAAFAAGSHTNITITYDDALDKFSLAASGGGAVSDSPYGVGWNGDTTNAPSKNSVYDKLNAMDTTIASKASSSLIGAVSGIASLDGAGQVPMAQLPVIAFVDVNTVANQAAQLALTAQEGDVAIRTDQNKSYIHNGGGAGTMADWSELRTPTDQVLSVAGLTGAISAAGLKTALALVKADVGLGSVDNTADSAKPVSTAQQTALNLKADTSALANYSPVRPTVTAISTSRSAADSDNNNHIVASGASKTLTLGNITAGTSFTVRFTTAWSLSCAGGLSKNGADPTGITTGSVAANSLITFLHEGAGVWVASGAGLT